MWRAPLRAAFRSQHARSMAMVMAACAFAQLVVLVAGVHPIVLGDTPQYVAAADRIVGLHGFLDRNRPPVYPLFLAAIFAVTAHSLVAVVVVQAFLFVAMAFEAYAIVWWVTSNRWLAALGGALVGGNVWVLQWERAILSDGPAAFLLMTSLFVLANLARRPTPRRAIALGTVMVLTHVATVFAAVALAILAAVSFRRLRTGAVVGAILVAAMTTLVIANGLTFSYFGPDLRKFVMIKAATCGNAIEAFAETC